MRRDRIGFYFYLGAVTVAGWFCLSWLTVYNFPGVDLIPVVLFWCLLAIGVEFLPVPLPQGGFVTLGFPIIFASLLLWGPVVGSWVAITGAILGVGWSRRLKLYQIVFDSAQLVLTVVSSSFVFKYSGGVLLGNNPLSYVYLIPIGWAVITYFLVNSFAVSAALALQQRTSPWQMWLANFKGVSPNYLAQAPLAILMAMIYKLIGWWAVLFFLTPIYVGYHVFKLYSDIRQKHLSIIRSLAAAIEMRDPYTEEHSRRMVNYAVATARELRMSMEQIETIRYATILHDIGKIGISDQILAKPGLLEKDERKAIEEHSRIGADIIKEIDALKDVALLLYHHHERYDGTGYPEKLKGEDIPLGARIISVIDAYDAMTSKRPYRLALSQQQAVEELIKGSGTQFDQRVVTVFLKVLKHAT